jgi:hypothetical protein
MSGEGVRLEVIKHLYVLEKDIEFRVDFEPPVAVFV